MKVYCEECGSILVPEKEYWELNTEERERERIITFEHEYRECRDEFIQARMRKHLDALVQMRMLQTQLAKRWRKEVESLSKDIVRDYKGWESGRND